MCIRDSSLFKAELVRNKGPWKNIDDLEIAVAEYIDWFNHRRLHGEIGLIPPTEHEDTYYRQNSAPATAEASVASLLRSRHETTCLSRASRGAHGVLPSKRLLNRSS